ncbi:Methyltransferase domain-containing protein [Pollutimonas bauzanensis]|uniref:Methyltransferase domain-containing protein n=2 Tax=Pollutimonas bauzanensis TaxID=658167 RepID=A0A1M5MU12_9BURK|nr:Methyltransferase domain-containing protein [Pollutimonas bauzanensis]
MQKDNIEQMQNLAQQLREPHGADGIEVAATMHQSNIGMTRACFASLAVAPGETLLEIGHGNGAHVPEFFEDRPSLLYQGLELSALMQREATRLNRDLVSNGKARFEAYGGFAFPFGDQSFDKAMTVNTLYFLPDPLAFLSQIHRTLKLGGNFSMAFAAREFMQTLSFASYGFRLYDVEEVRQMVSSSGLEVLGTDVHEETVMSKERPGTSVRREFIVIRAGKRTTQ